MNIVNDEELDDHIKETVQRWLNEKNDNLVIKYNKLTKIPEQINKFSWLKKLEIPNCSLDILCNLPSGLIYLDCNSNSIEIIQPSSLPESLEELNISSNSIRGTLKLILPNLTKLNCKSFSICN